MAVFRRSAEDAEIPPGLTQAVAVPYSAPRPLVAAAARVQVRNKEEVEQLKKRRSSMAWQTEAWEYFDLVGEIKYAFMLSGAIMSRMKVYVALITKPSDPPSALEDVPDKLPEGMADVALAHLRRLESCLGGIPGMMRDLSININVAGEAYLVQQLPEPLVGTPEQWSIKSIDEVQVDGSGKISISSGVTSGNAGMVPLRESAFIGRIWRPHPRWSDLADSSMRALLELCLAEGTLIYTPSGPRPIEQVRAGDEVLAMRDGSLVRATVSAAARTKEQASTIRIVTSQGHVITGTPEHPVLVLQYDSPGKGRARNYELIYKRLGDIERGDTVVASNGVDGLIDGDGTTLSYAEAWLAGVYTGDGCDVGAGRKARVCYPDPLLAVDVERYAAEIWDGETVRVGNDLSLPSGSRQWVQSLGLNVKSPERTIPDEVWASGPKVWQAFIDGFERTDVYHNRRRGYTTYGSTSYALLRGMQAMHRMLGRRTSTIRQCRTAGPVEMVMPDSTYVAQAHDMWTMDVYTNDIRNGRGTLIKTKPKVAALLPDERLTLATVKRIENGPQVDVYDLTVPDTDNFLAEGVVVHNCAELLLLNRAVRATAKSRLNAGALFIPDGLAVAAQPDVVTEADEDGVSEVDEEASAFEEELIAAMTMPIQDEDSASAVVPLLIRGPGELGAQIKQFKFERSFDPALVERADKVLERIMQGLDIPKDVVTGLANIKYALTTDAQILTRDGWKFHDQVRVGDHVYTLNHTTGLGEWQPLLEVNVFDHDGEVLSINNRGHVSLSTAEHRWPIERNGERTWTTSEIGFAEGDQVPLAARCVGDDESDVRFARYAAARATGATITTARPDWPWLETVPEGERPDVWFSVDPERYDREAVDSDGVLRLDFVSQLSPAAAEALVATFVEFKWGWQPHPTLDRFTFWHEETRHLDAIEMAAVLAGYAVSRAEGRHEVKRHRGVDWLSPDRNYTVLHIARDRTTFDPSDAERRGNLNWLGYHGQVWCPTTANHTWLARQGGAAFFTGNSNAVVINESMYRAHVEPMTLLFVDALTMMYMRPALLAAGYPQEEVDKVIVWYDPSDILTSQDRAASANDGWDRYLLSGPAWRSAHGFSEADAPHGDELVKRITVSRGQLSAEFTEGVLMQVAPELMAKIREGNLAASDVPMPENLAKMLGGQPPSGNGAAPEGPPASGEGSPEGATPAEGTEPVQPEKELTPIPPEILQGLPLPMLPE